MKKEITQERLRELFNLDPETGSLYWKRNIIGGVAGCLRTDGYWNIFIDGKFYQRGRVVFLFCTGFLPKELITETGFQAMIGHPI